jgi:hypothetical protein
MCDRSSRPRRTPTRTERRIIKVRDGGHKTLDRPAGRRNRRNAGYSYLHTAVDDYSRLSCSEIHADEKKGTATGFWTRARAFFAQAGITVERVPNDNGACRSDRPSRNCSTHTVVGWGRQARTPVTRIPVGEVLVTPQPVQPVSHPHRRGATRVARPRDLRGQRRDLLIGTRAKGQRAPQRLRRALEQPRACPLIMLPHRGTPRSPTESGQGWPTSAPPVLDDAGHNTGTPSTTGTPPEATDSTRTASLTW